jgi:hypothetical protein
MRFYTFNAIAKGEYESVPDEQGMWVSRTAAEARIAQLQEALADALGALGYVPKRGVEFDPSKVRAPRNRLVPQRGVDEFDPENLACSQFVVDPDSRFCLTCGYPRHEHRKSSPQKEPVEYTGKYSDGTSRLEPKKDNV